MQITFDISADELPVFLAEVGEQLQVLDEGLVILERQEYDPELLQALFRAAHTLKGSAGMINHRRMVDLTHAMETALDGLRKDQIAVSVPLIDACLEAVDALRELSQEVTTGQASLIDTSFLVDRFQDLVDGGKAACSSSSASLTRSEGQASGGFASQDMTRASQTEYDRDSPLEIRAEISPGSIASAARAFQLMLALQELGEIVFMQPHQAQIETAEPVHLFIARIVPATSLDEIRKRLSEISEIDRLLIGDEAIQEASMPIQRAELAAAGAETAVRLGDYLVQQGLITQDQLDSALKVQSQSDSPGSALGNTLVKMGAITQEVLDQVLVEKKQARPTVAAEQALDRARTRLGEKTVRTSVERLDNLMNLVGELITDRNRLNLLRSELEGRYRNVDEIEVLSETITHVGRITDQLQAEVMGIRMLPISNVFNKFPRLVRDVSRKANKQIDLVIRGEDTELDRSVIEEINDPLIHLLRNAVDHGIESPEERLAAGKLARGTILLTARHEQGRILITVEDDGRGIPVNQVKEKAIARGAITEKEAQSMSDEEAVELIFVPGLSTAKTVSDISGRGVGMDIVRNNLERVNGNIHVETWAGRGSRFQIILPLTLAIMPTLLVRVQTEIFAIPLVMVTETLLIPRTDIQTINGRPVIQLRNHVLPVVRLEDVYEMPARHEPNRRDYVVVVRSGKVQLGLIVDFLIGEQEVVVKSLSSILGDVPGISGAAILGDGHVALIADVQGLLKLAAGMNIRWESALGAAPAT